MRHCCLALVCLAAVAPPADARLIVAAPAVPVAARAAIADVVLVGTVTAIEPATVPVLPFPGADKPIPFSVAVVKVETAVRGVGAVTHLRVGFPAPVTPAAPVPGAPRLPARINPYAVRLAAGQKVGLFLAKHPTADFLVVPTGLMPVDLAANKQAAADMARGVKVAADPVAALKAPAAKDRAFAAMVLVHKYRTPPLDGSETDAKPLSAEESGLILGALTEQADWVKGSADGPSVGVLFGRLGITAADGFPEVAARPGQPFAAAQREAFLTWRSGAGKDYRVNALVRKPDPKAVKPPAK